MGAGLSGSAMRSVWSRLCPGAGAGLARLACDRSRGRGGRGPLWLRTARTGAEEGSPGSRAYGMPRGRSRANPLTALVLRPLIGGPCASGPQAHLCRLFRTFRMIAHRSDRSRETPSLTYRTICPIFSSWTSFSPNRSGPPSATWQSRRALSQIR